jgi:hypothetical protein
MQAVLTLYFLSASLYAQTLLHTQARYHVEDYVAYDKHRPRAHAFVTSFVLDPLFAGHCRFFMKEVTFFAGSS